jgi:predicted tellurium resistance membrane protein TerC
LKRQIPYLIGGTITGIFVSYYYGFLFAIIVNSIAWFAISTIVNKFYWHYSGFKDELYLVSKYIIHRKNKKETNSNLQYDTYNKVDYEGERHDINNLKSISKNIGNDKSSDVGSHIK